LFDEVTKSISSNKIGDQTLHMYEIYTQHHSFENALDDSDLHPTLTRNLRFILNDLKFLPSRYTNPELICYFWISPFGSLSGQHK